MALANHSDFTTAITDWLNRSGHTAVTNKIDDFLELAQEKINTDLDLSGMEAVTTLSVDAQSEAKPTGVGSIISIIISNCPLRQGTVEEINRYTVAGTPEVYDVVGDNIYFGPTPSSAVTATIHYTANVDPLTSSNTTNWFSANAKNLLLYQSLVQAYLFMKDDNRVQFWKQEYETAKNSLDMKNFRQDAKNAHIRDNAIEAYGGPLV